MIFLFWSISIWTRSLGPLNTQLVGQWSMKNQSHWPETEGTPMKSALFALNQTYVATKLYTLILNCAIKKQVLTFHCGVSYRKYASNYISRTTKFPHMRTITSCLPFCHFPNDVWWMIKLLYTHKTVSFRSSGRFSCIQWFRSRHLGIPGVVTLI